MHKHLSLNSDQSQQTLSKQPAAADDDQIDLNNEQMEAEAEEASEVEHVDQSF